MVTTTANAPNGLLLVHTGLKHCEIPPNFAEGQLVSASPSCIAIGCQHEFEGPVEVSVGSVAPLGLDLAFDGVISVRSKTLEVGTVNNESILEVPMSSGLVRIKVWVDDPREPSKVGIELVASESA